MIMLNKATGPSCPSDTRTPVIIAGPTASGKSALALALAERDTGWVINADALQVYGCWRVLTSRPGADDLARAPHRLYGHVAAEQRYSVGAWLRELAATLAEAKVAGARPIIVGGTGLYLSAVITGIAHVPPVPREVSARSNAAIRDGRLDDLVAELAARDPATLGEIDVRNPARVQRAWDVLTATGRGLSDWRAATVRPLIPPEDAVRIVLNVETPRLEHAIAERFVRMLATGALGECADFLATGYDPDAPSGKALGAPQLIEHLRGETTLAEASAAATLATKRFAKRQRTWFRGRMRNWTWIDPVVDDPLRKIPGP